MPAEMPAKQQREQQRGLSAFPRLAVFVVGLVLVLVVAGLIRSILPKRLSNTVSGFTGDFRGNVAVGVHGQRDLAVTEDFHDDTGGHAEGPRAQSGPGDLVKAAPAAPLARRQRRAQP